jgi:choline dehydrogenase-like flavoprotein
MKTTEDHYDAVVVGSGAGGGIAAYVMTLRGLNVLLLEAGRNYDPAVETPMFQVEGDAPLNGAATPDKPLGFYDATVNGGFEIPGEPYAVADGTQFLWWRARMLGGRTNHWGRIMLRYGPHDFCTYSREGLGMDWPISYETLAPYYDRVEKLIGVFGAAEGIENSPDSPPDVLLPPPPMHAHELWMQMSLAKRLGIRAVATHAAVLTRPLNGRPACLYATDCRRGCSIRANFQSTTVLLPPALATGHLEIRTGAMVYEVPLDQHGRATGVRFIDTSTAAQHFARGRAVILAASACESARILLNSKSTSFPDGLANSSGQVGRNLTDSVALNVGGDIPALQGLRPFNDDGTSTGHAYVPWWAYHDKRGGQLSFSTQYHVEISGGRTMPSVGDFTELPEERGRPVYGQALRTQLRNQFGSKVVLTAFGGMIPNPDCRCEIDPSLKDRFGIPVLRFHWKWSAQEVELARHALKALCEMISAMGGKPIVDTSTGGSSISNVGGGAAHEVGTARMGAKASNSVLNSFGCTWDVRNLYVADGASFAGQADKNPTETIVALAWRASDHLMDSFVRKEI